MDKILIIADDLTGAADTGVQFCPYFEETVLVAYHQLTKVFETASDSVSRAIAVYTSSRALNKDRARERLRSVAGLFLPSKPKWLYKKVDSCLRGNLGAEIEAVMDTLGYELSFIAPAFPEMGRTTINDIHKVQGVPVHRTEISRDPVTPVLASGLTQTIAQQGRYPVGHVTLDILEGDLIELQKEIERLTRRGLRHITFDSTSRAHLEKISRMFFSLPGRVLPVGSAGLAASLGQLISSKRGLKASARQVSDEGYHLLVCGTASRITKMQIEALVKTYPYEQVPLDPLMLSEPKRRDDFLNRVPAVRSKLLEKNVVVRIKSPSPDDLLDKGDSPALEAGSIVAGLALFIASVLSNARPGLLFITGGDTAEAVLKALNVSYIQLYGEIVAGMANGRIIGGILDGVPLVTKAGAFGKADALVELHEIWHAKKMV